MGGNGIFVAENTIDSNNNRPTITEKVPSLKVVTDFILIKVINSTFVYHHINIAAHEKTIIWYND